MLKEEEIRNSSHWNTATHMWLDFQKPEILVLNLLKYFVKIFKWELLKINSNIQIPVVVFKYSQISTTMFLRSS